MQSNRKKQHNIAKHNTKQVQEFFEFFGNDTGTIFKDFLFEQMGIFCMAENGMTDKHKQEVVGKFQILYELLTNLKNPVEQ